LVKRGQGVFDALVVGAVRDRKKNRGGTLRNQMGKLENGQDKKKRKGGGSGGTEFFNEP